MTAPTFGPLLVRGGHHIFRGSREDGCHITLCGRWQSPVLPRYGRDEPRPDRVMCQRCARLAERLPS